MTGKRVPPPAYLLVSLVLMGALDLLCPVTEILPRPWNLLGIIPLACGVVINIIADRAFRKAGTTVKPFEESTALVTTGAYRITRHPMYLGFVLILVGVAALLGSLTPCVVIPVFAIVMDRVFVSVEERMLQERFGQAWSAYKAKVRRRIWRARESRRAAPGGNDARKSRADGHAGVST